MSRDGTSVAVIPAMHASTPHHITTRHNADITPFHKALPRYTTPLRPTPRKCVHRQTRSTHTFFKEFILLEVASPRLSSHYSFAAVGTGSESVPAPSTSTTKRPSLDTSSYPFFSCRCSAAPSCAPSPTNAARVAIGNSQRGKVPIAQILYT